MTSSYELESLGTRGTRKMKRGPENSRRKSYKGGKRGKPEELVSADLLGASSAVIVA